MLPLHRNAENRTWTFLSVSSTWPRDLTLWIGTDYRGFYYVSDIHQSFLRSSFSSMRAKEVSWSTTAHFQTASHLKRCKARVRACIITLLHLLKYDAARKICRTKSTFVSALMAASSVLDGCLLTPKPWSSLSSTVVCWRLCITRTHRSCTLMPRWTFFWSLQGLRDHYQPKKDV